MAKFCKLFERGDRQVLVTKTWTDDDKPQLIFKTETLKSGHSIELKLAFTGKTGQKKRDDNFNKLTEDEAFKIIDSSPGINM